jgi:hypothetical protein
MAAFGRREPDGCVGGTGRRLDTGPKVRRLKPAYSYRYWMDLILEHGAYT